MSVLARNDICVGEEVKIAVNIALDRFRQSDEQKGKWFIYIFPDYQVR